MITKKIVVIGGGTGTFTVLSGLKRFRNVELTAIVSMADSGGCNRILRDDFGLLPTSDIRQCLVALVNVNGDGDLWRKLFSYRFDKGVGISGMTFGNLFMAALSDILGSQTEAIKKTGEILKIKGKILPVSLDDVQLLATYENDSQIVGEHFIDEPKKEHNGKLHIKNLKTVPKGKVNSEAVLEIKRADFIILGPGDLYTSILANLVISGLSEAIVNSKAKLLYIVNLMTKYGQTYKMTASDHAKEIEKYLGGKKERIDYVIINSGKIKEEILKKYQKENADAVYDDLEKTHYKVIKTDLLSSLLHQKISGDILKRSLIRHDIDKLAKAILSI